MATEVLRPQDCLFERIRVPQHAFSRRRIYGNYCNYYYNNNNNNYNNVHASSGSRSGRKPVTRPERVDQRKRGVVLSHPEPSVSKRSGSSDDLRVAKSSGMVMEKVTILRRGESLDSMVKSEALKKGGEDLVVCGTERLGPDPQLVPRQIRIVDMKPGLSPVAVKSDVYAGSAFAVSPSPSALPLPSFSKKQALAVVDDTATRDLRRLLRLE